MSSALERAARGEPLPDQDALELGEASPGLLPGILGAAQSVRDQCWGRRVTFSPKVFLPITNLCRNRCDYCSFRRSAGDAGEWTMTPIEIRGWLERGYERNCREALLCLGDKPESAFTSYRRTLAELGHASTVDYLESAARLALECGLLPHTNAGVLSLADMQQLKPVNVSLGLMLENVSDRLCGKGMPHYKAPDKRPARRLRMLSDAGMLKIPFTTGILVGIGETRRERVESLLAIRRLHREYGHIQEVIVQSFTPRPGIAMAGVKEPALDELLHAVALARLILDPEVGVQVPPNLTPGALELLLDAGINDLGGISPVTPDYISPRHAWPELFGLARLCRRLGYSLEPRLSVYPSFVARAGFIDRELLEPIRRAEAGLGRAFTFDDPRTAQDALGECS